MTDLNLGEEAEWKTYISGKPGAEITMFGVGLGGKEYSESWTTDNFKIEYLNDDLSNYFHSVQATDLSVFGIIFILTPTVSENILECLLVSVNYENCHLCFSIKFLIKVVCEKPITYGL